MEHGDTQTGASAVPDPLADSSPGAGLSLDPVAERRGMKKTN
jgi:hypothetical protein